MKENHSETAAALRGTLTRLIRQLRKQQAASDFSNAEILTMSLLDQYGDMLPSELSALERISAQGISQILNRLQDTQCISRKVEDEDKRKVRVTLTESGRGHLTKTRKIKEKWLIQAMEKLFSPGEIRILQDAIPLMQKLADYEEKEDTE
ncbi:MAG: MarR family transcriptional regulator [Mucilaginibacter polytrichastri]|nr:MarR family transcriptional regulator [Mucilaginibacter polytrichastri]